MQKIILSELDKKILTEHAENEKPNESCAILFGKDNLISEVFLTKNIEKSSVNFTISNEQLIEGYKIAEEKKVEVIGIFHSHPNSDAGPDGVFDSEMMVAGDKYEFTFTASGSQDYYCTFHPWMIGTVNVE